MLRGAPPSRPRATVGVEEASDAHLSQHKHSQHGVPADPPDPPDKSGASAGTRARHGHCRIDR
eukprot:4308220-Pyramimonas_sp.AAC.1